MSFWIYKTTKFHSGVDYAAPRGTAIYASGAGTIEMARYVNGYGNFIKIRHNSEYETAYGHMQKFAAGMRCTYPAFYSRNILSDATNSRKITNFKINL